MKQKIIKITLIKSPIGRLKNHKACVRGLGLNKINSKSNIKNTSANRGMINKISYLLKIED